MGEPEKGAAAQVRRIAEVILGRDYVSKMLKWYEEITNSDHEYVVFVVRRCYLLVIILSKILNIPRGLIKREKDSGTVFLTDAASCLQCQKMAEYYRERKTFPRLLFVDDILIHGRNLNRLIYDMERKIYKELKDEYEEEEIRRAFVHAVEIKVFARAKGVLLLREMYERKLSYEMLLSAKEWRELSSNISLLILNTDISNASFVFSQNLTEEEFESLRKRSEFADFKESIYQGTKQYTQVRFLIKEGMIKAIYTLRIVDNNYMDGYRVLPFVFLPELDEAETLRIVQAAGTRIKCKTWLDKLYATEEKRSSKELLTLIFSHVLLQTFNDKFNIKRDVEISEDWKEEIEKLVRNYNNTGVDRASVRNNLKEIVASRLFSEGELDEIFLTCVSGDHYIAEAAGEGRELGYSEKERILRWEEEHFWECGRDAERTANEYNHLLYLPSKKRCRQVMNAVENELQKMFTRYPTLEVLKTGVIYLLHLMDAGVVALTLIVPIDFEERGYAQYVKYGEQSLLYPTIKLYEYIPMLVMMQRKCEEAGRSMINEIELLDQSGLLAREGLKFDKEDIRDYINDLKEMGHRVEDWSGNFYQRRALSEPGAIRFTVRWLIEFRELQNQYVNTYAKYLENRKY